MPSNHPMRLVKPDGSLDVSGVSLPGGPLIIAGSNTYVAWGFTNTSGDWGDLIQLRLNPNDDNQYLTDQGYQSFVSHQETINVKGEAAVVLTVKDTVWGPVVKGASDDLMAYKWVAHYAQGMNGGLLQLENMRSVEQTLSIVDSIGMPAQNAMLADRFGNIAWTVFGAIPQRRNFTTGVDYSIPGDWSDGQHGWDGWYSSAQYPQTKNPKNYRLWTANGRVASGKDLAIIGDGQYALGARAKQIRDDLLALKGDVKEQDLLDIQLDDRAIFLMRWQKLMLSVVQNSENKQLKILQLPIKNWGARASVDSIGYRLVKQFRLATARKLFASITAPCKQKYKNCNYYRATHLWEDPLWALVQSKNTNWLPEGHQQWQQFLESIMLQNFKTILNDKTKLNDYTWGNKNYLQIKHPLSRFVPGLSFLTDMPGKSYSGDRDMPKVATPRFGASERLVISPGHEADAILHMPTSQAGHPLSPYFGVGHEDWVEGKATPLLPAETVWTLKLVP
jgi:penicillin amidase